MKMSLDGSGVQKVLNRAKASIKQFAGDAIRQFGALAGVAGMGMLANKAVQLGSKISDLSEQLRINAVSLQTLQAVAVKAGVDQSTLERAIRNVTIRTQEAIDGNNTYGDAFRRLGIDLKTFTKLPTEQKLQKIADAYKASGKSQEAFADVANILGQRAGPKMLEVLRQIADEGLTELERKAQDAGMVMSNELIANLDEAADMMGKFDVKATVMAAKVLGVVMPGLSMLGNGFGFISEVVAVSIANIMAFAKLIGANLAAVVAPAIASLGALAKSFQSITEAAKGNFSEAKKLAGEAVEGQKKSFSELVNIPSKIADNFKKMGAEVKSNVGVMGDFLDERAKKSESSWNDLLENIGAKSKKVEEDVMNSSVVTTGGTSGGGGTTSGAKQGGKEDPSKMGLNIERGEFESRKAFLTRREQSRKAHLQLNEAKRQIGAGSEAYTPAKLEALKAQAMGKSSGGDPILEATKDIAETNRTIARELVK